MNKLVTIVLSIPLVVALQSALACDNKACNKAYISSTFQYILNQGRQESAARKERELMQ